MKTYPFLLAIALSLTLLLSGCTKPAESAYSIDYFAISSQEHVFSKTYALLLRLSDESFNSSSTLVIRQDGGRITEFPLDTSEIPPNNELSIPFYALEVGEHELTAVIEDENGTGISNEKTLSLSIIPLGFYDFENEENSYQIEPNIWCAQEFTLENNAVISSIELQLRSLIQTRPGKSIILELRTPSGNLPGTTAGNLILNATLPSDSPDSSPSWQAFQLPNDEFPAGTYWILLKREDTVGNVAWTYSDESLEGRAVCRDLSKEGPWAPIEGGFAFKIE